MTPASLPTLVRTIRSATRLCTHLWLAAASAKRLGGALRFAAGSAKRLSVPFGLLGVFGLLSACGSSSTSFVSIGGGTTGTGTLTSISVAPANSSLPLGLTRQFTATALYSNGTTLDVSATATWTSSTPNTATTNSTGLVTARNLGTTTVTATLGAVSGSTPLTVTAATLVSIDVTPVGPTILSAMTQQFTATGVYTDLSTQNITAAVTWSSSNLIVATISNAPGTVGLATGVSGGTSTITATSGTATGSTILTVTGPSLVSIAVTPVNPTILNGTTLQFVATGTYSDQTTKPLTNLVTWNSGTPAVATIGNAANPPSTPGLATSASTGKTLITATYTGAPTPITSPPQTLTVINEYAYATNTNQPTPNVAGTISQYTVGLDGILTPFAAPAATAPAGYFAFSIAINPAGTFAYVANYNKTGNPQNSTIFQYSISPVTGALTEIGTPVVTASNPNSVTIDPSGKYLYVSNNQETDVSEFVIQPDGTLTNPPGVMGVGGAIFPSGAGPASIAINPAGTFAYVANYNDGTLSQYSIGPGGALQAIAAEPAFVNASSGPSYVIVDPTGHYVYVTNQGAGNLSEYSIGPDGALTNIGTTTVVPATSIGPSFIAIDASGHYAYVADSDSNDISQYAITNGGMTAGQLTLLATFPTGPGSAPYGLTIDATGKYLYVAERITAGAIAQFSISALDGSLTPLAPATVPAGAAPTSIVTTH